MGRARGRHRHHRDYVPCAGEELGDIVYAIDLPEGGHGRGVEGEDVRVCGIGEGGERYLCARYRGEVTEANELLATKPEKLNEDPHGAAWLIKVRVSNAEEFSNLMSAAGYQKYVGAES